MSYWCHRQGPVVRGADDETVEEYLSCVGVVVFENLKIFVTDFDRLATILIYSHSANMRVFIHHPASVLYNRSCF